MSHPRRRSERGQIVVLAAVMLPALLLFAAMIIDTGLAYLVRRNAQSGADAVALAAARTIGESCDDRTVSAVQTTVANYASANGVTASVQLEPTPLPSPTPSCANTATVTAFTTVTVPAILPGIAGPVLGTPAITVSAAATATINGFLSR